MLKAATRNIYVKPLLSAPELAARQARIARGLLADGCGRDEIRKLQWYDERLEVHVSFPGDVTLDVTLPAPVTPVVTLLASPVTLGSPVDGTPLDEAPEDRSRRLARERQQRSRAAKRAPSE